MDTPRPIKRALLSVSDKTGIVDFARSLAQKGVDILSTGGTAKLLADNGIQVTEVSKYTGHPEIMDGRVKTLHPKVHGGILARRGIDEAVMTENDISAIDIVVVNLYPFANAVSDENCSLENAIENIDIGGPTMVRAAAKNHKDVTIVVNAGDYDRVLAEMNANDDSLKCLVLTVVIMLKLNSKKKINSHVPLIVSLLKLKIYVTVKTLIKMLLFMLKRTHKKRQFQPLSKFKVKHFRTIILLTLIQL